MRSASRLALVSVAAVVAYGCVSVSPAASTDPTPSSSTSEAPTVEVPDNLLFRDDFEGATRYLSNASQRGLGVAEYTDGVFRITSEPSRNESYVGGGTVTWCLGADCRPPDVVHEDLESVVVEVDVVFASGSELGWYGIACNYEGTGVLGGFTGFTISADGRHSAIARNDEPGTVAFATLRGGAIRGDATPAIRPGAGVANRLRADCGRERLALTVNDQLVATAPNDAPLDSDAPRGVGLVVAAGPDEATTVEFDNLEVSSLEAEPVGVAEPPLIFEDPLRQEALLWPIGSFGVASAEVTDEGVHVEVTRENAGWFGIPGTMNPPADSLSEVTVVSDDESGGVAALLCRVATNEWYGFYLLIDEFGDGYAGINYFPRGGEPEILSDWVPVESLVLTEGTPVDLGFECAGDSLWGYANGMPIVGATDTRITEAGSAGIHIASDFSQDRVAFDVSDFRIVRPQ